MPGSADSGQRERTLLFVDDEHILYRSGTRRVMQFATRYEHNPVIRPSEPWETAIAWTSVYRHPETGRYQLWYQAFAGRRARQASHRCVVCYAVSEDGVHFVKPKLDLFAFNDTQQTNIVLVGNGGHSLRYANAVLVDEREADPQKRYRMAYSDWAVDGDQEYTGLCVAFSPDGIHWTNHPRAPLLRTAYGTPGESVPFRRETQRPWAIPLSMADAVDVFFDPGAEAFVWTGKMWLDGPDGGMFWKHTPGLNSGIASVWFGTLSPDRVSLSNTRVSDQGKSTL